MGDPMADVLVIGAGMAGTAAASELHRAGLSVVVAFFVGTIEVLGLIAQQSHLTGGWWGLMRSFNLNTAGFVIVGMFVLTWVVALAVWHFGRIEERWEAAASSAD